MTKPVGQPAKSLARGGGGRHAGCLSNLPRGRPIQLKNLITILAALWFALLVPGLAHAFGATQCAASRFGSDLVCSANDVSISSVAAVGGVPSCIGGQSVTLDLDVTVRFATPDRWDIGIFISNDGKDGSLLPANGGAASCNVAILPPSAPFLNLDPGPWSGVLDRCGDGNGTIGGGSGTGVLRMNQVTMGCKAVSSTGKLHVPFVVSWDNGSSPSGATCTSANDPVPNTKSKCNATATSTVDVIVQPAISKTDGLTRMTPGDTTSYAVTISNFTGFALSAALGNAAVFKDPAVTNLNVSSVTCAATGGAVCPVGVALTVANMQGASGIPVPSMPVDSTVVFTVNAQLVGNPRGTITNVASVTSHGFAASASDVNDIVYPSLLVMKTVSVLSDPVNGTASPKNIPGAQVLYTVTVSNTGLGTADLNGLTITDPLSSSLEFFVGTAGSPVTFTQGTPSSNLLYSFTSLASATDDISFSSDGGSTFGYTPVPNAGGYDSATGVIRINPKGRMAAWSGTGSYPSFSLGFRARVK